MSAAHTHGDGGGGSGYYSGGRGDVLARQRQDEAAWRSGYYPQEAGANWVGGGAGGGAAGTQNSPYPNYDPNTWSCSGHPQPPYPPHYPAGGPRMEPYTNGSYGPPYTQPSMNSPYPNLPPQNHYFPPPGQPHYPVDPYKQSSGNSQAPPPWGMSPHAYHNVSPQAQGYPQYPAQHTMPQQSPQGEGWGVYGAPNPYQWSPAPPVPPNQAGSHYAGGGRTSWQGADVQSAAYDTKDASQTPSYNQQRPYQGYPDQPQAAPASEPKPNPPNPHYSASPQMYNRNDPTTQPSSAKTSEPNLPAADSVNVHPGILKINQVLEKMVDLEQEVDEFVGKKSDMSYRCLEELLTKQLLELDSVETGGQENVRQARKEAVRKLQSILENLERKGL
ncbi:BAG family molecular chaperone regulator 4 isoform X2 [Spea bombifrons]|uniref:BAG family molecular chaperone regulator 4 isoform X2 n=1 Tax=Spea bombifrons TaxID=233779 RepID=UPI0023496957|nr:BAG family molecular chaperone regulator 4 isoform X2 [Spea bombifrons]